METVRRSVDAGAEVGEGRINGVNEQSPENF